MASVPLALVAVSGDFPEKTLVDLGRYDVEILFRPLLQAEWLLLLLRSVRVIKLSLDLKPKELQKYNFSPLDILNKLTQLNTFLPNRRCKSRKTRLSNFKVRTGRPCF